MRLSVSDSAVSIRIGTFLSRAALGQVDAAFARHHDVEDQQVEIQAGELAPRFAGIAGDRDAKAVLGRYASADCGCGCRHRRPADAAHRRPVRAGVIGLSQCSPWTFP